jgi:hypothetical protein
MLSSLETGAPLRKWNIQDSQGQIIILAFRSKSLKPVKLFPWQYQHADMALITDSYNHATVAAPNPQGGLDFIPAGIHHEYDSSPVYWSR